MNDHRLSPCAIRFRGVGKKYNGTEVLKDLSFSIAKGELITVIGSSGCGKTTMLKLINGLLTPDTGKIYVNGENIAETNQIELRRRIGYVIQNIGLFPHLSVEKNIEFIPGLLKYDRKTAGRIARRLIQTVGLSTDMLNSYPSELSGGQKQRVGVARALAASPEILLMDEPFGALDEITRNKLQNELLKIRKDLNLTIVFITHDLNEAAKLGDRIFIMDKGTLVSVCTRRVAKTAGNPKPSLFLTPGFSSTERTV